MKPSLQMDTNATMEPKQAKPAQTVSAIKKAQTLREKQIECCELVGLVADRARRNPEPRTLKEAYEMAEATAGGG